MSTDNRRGLTLIEVLVVIAIIGILFGFILSAVMRVRESALRSESSNNLRQIIIAVHNYAGAHGGHMPTIGEVQRPPIGTLHYPPIPAPALFVRILPYVEQANIPSGVTFPVVHLYMSPADPTAYLAASNGESVTSYAANGQVFNTNPRLPATFADGTSNTIAFAEHYSKCGRATFHYWVGSSGGRRASFADDGDMVPVTTGNPPVSGCGGFPHLSFQVAPSVRKCFSLVAQTPHSSGMLVAMGDGSVRSISGSVSPEMYWAAVTPASGEALSLD